MSLDLQKIEENLCRSLCAEIRLVAQDGLTIVETPFFFPDGDPYQLYLKELPGGNIQLSDMGHTMMQLSYENDITKLREGTRGKLFEQIKGEFDLNEREGEFFLESNPENLSSAVFKLGQAITKISDLTFLNRARVESTFYQDLKERLERLVDSKKIIPDYLHPELDHPEDYPIDYRIDGKYSPLFLFGIPGRDKARLTTIVLERLLRTNSDFESLLIFANQQDIPKADLARLSNAGGEMIASLDAETAFERKLLRKVS